MIWPWPTEEDEDEEDEDEEEETLPEEVTWHQLRGGEQWEGKSLDAFSEGFYNPPFKSKPWQGEGTQLCMSFFLCSSSRCFRLLLLVVVGQRG